MDSIKSTYDQPARVSLRRPALLAWLRMARVFSKIDRASSDEMRCRGLSLAQFDVLAHVGAREGVTQQELADALLVTKGNVCQLLDRMERSGLIERQQDGRSNRLFPTEEGRRVFHSIVPSHEDHIVDKFDVLTAEEQTQLLALLRKLDRALV
jgi:DNA-binding MarR family transcriptional regulator